MTKSETLVWNLASHRIIRQGDGWWGTPKYSVSTKWETKLEGGIEVQDKWEHKEFKDIDKALEYYKSIVELARHD